MATNGFMPTMPDTEDRAGVDRIDDLLAKRDVIVRELARLRPLYGPLALFTHLRKIELARITALLRALATAAGEKVTEARLDTEAHGHPDYVTMIAHATIEAARWVEAEEALAAIDMRHQRAQGLLRWSAAEPR